MDPASQQVPRPDEKLLDDAKPRDDLVGEVA
jgi:hypothetical protein